MRKSPIMLAAVLFCARGIELSAQSVNVSQQVVLQGLRSSTGQGNFTAAAYSPDGKLYLLLDQRDGIRILKTDASAHSVLAQRSTGAAGDVGVAMAVTADGSVYVTGTSSSGSLAGTAGVPYPTAADSSTNSFLAKFDANLNLVFLTFLGSGRTAAAGLAATSDSVFVTGTTFSNSFPVTAAGIQQSPANGTTGNGFVERFSSDGTKLQYATYLTGVGGSTTPTAIVADAADNAYVAGSTAASGFPTVLALQPERLLAPGASSSGFLTKLNPEGSAFVFSTFIAGSGITGMDLDASTNTLLLTGNVSPGQFPVAAVAMPLTSATYQTLLRIPEDGQTVTEGVLLTSGSTSYVRAGGAGDAWIAGAIAIPLFPGITPPDYNAGDSYLLHVTSTGTIDQTIRLGGLPKNGFSYASLTSTVAQPAVSGTTVSVPGRIVASISASQLAIQTFDLPTVQTPNALLPNTLRDIVPTAAACGTSSVCTGSGAMLAQVSTSSASPALSLSIDDLPNITARNLGSGTATGFAIAASGYSVTTDCGSSLSPSGLCHVALNGGGPGTLTVSASQAAAETVTLPATLSAPDALVLGTDELDFGIVSAAAGVVTRTVTVSNLSTQPQAFTSVRDSGSAAYSLTETSTSCAAGASAGQHLLAAGSSCDITLGLGASSAPTNDGAVRAAWKIGPRDILVTGFAQAAALSLSANEFDFGTYFAGGVRLPRYLYLSNNSTLPAPHAAAVLPPTSPFAVVDPCPATLQPKSVCQMILDYSPQSATASDTQTLTLDQGLSVLLTGEALPAQSVGGAAVNPNLSLSASQLSFTTAVTVTTISSAVLPLTVTNTGSSSLALATAMTGDFDYAGNCPLVLPAGASCTLLVSFLPSQPGLREGLLSVTAGSGYAPQYVLLSGTGANILPANNGVLGLGQTYVGEPLVVWYKIQPSLPTLTVSASGAGFGVALVADTGGGHGTLPPQAFASTATNACGGCWLGVQYLSPTAQSATGILALSSVAGGNPYLVTVSATSLSLQGLVLTPAVQDFGSISLGSSSGAMTFTLSNLIEPAVATTIESVTATGDFAVIANTTGGAACAGTVASTASCFVQVVFSPAATGNRTGTLSVTTSTGIATAALSGYGVANLGLAISPSALTFASVPNSTSTTQTITVTNLSSSSATVGSVLISDPTFVATSSCGILAGGTSCTILVTYAPASTLVSAVLSIPVTMTVNGQLLSTTYTVSLTGAYTVQNAGLEILPGAANYGAAATGSVGQTREYTLNNLSNQALNVTFSLARQFPLATVAPCTTLAVGASCSLSLAFAPMETGEQTGTILAQGLSTDGLTSTQALGYLQGYGSGSGAVTITGGTIPYSPLMFGQVTSGQSEQQRLSLTNTGTGTLTIRRISSAPPFLSTTDCGATMAPGAGCSVTITYAPSYELATGSAAGGTRDDAESLSIESDAATSPDFVAMTGLVLPVISASPVSSAALATYALSESALTFPNTQVGSASTAQTVTLTNTGTSTLHLLGMMTSPDFAVTSSCGTLLPGSACNLAVLFAPTTGTAQLRSGTLEIQSDATDSLEYVSLLGASTASALTLAPTALDFGTVPVGGSAALTISVTNNAASPVTFTGLEASGAFSVAKGTCPAIGSTLAAGASCALEVTFAPVFGGVQHGTLSLSSDSTQLALTVALTGTGLAPSLQVVPTSLNFGDVTVGASSSLTLTLTNVGATALAGLTNGLSGLNAGDFVVNVPCATTLAAGKSCSETLTFTPGATGARAAGLTIGSSDPSGAVVVGLNGNGAVAGSFVLTANGDSSATVSVTSGSPASYALLITPLNGFVGNVALTCTAVNAGRYASCSLLAPLLTLNGSAVGTTATISTLSAALQVANGAFAMVLLLSPVALRRRRRLWFLLICGAVLGCGSGVKTQSGTGGTVTTPAGSYQYQVTASSTSGGAISSTVTLNLVVQ